MSSLRTSVFEKFQIPSGEDSSNDGFSLVSASLPDCDPLSSAHLKEVSAKSKESVTCKKAEEPNDAAEATLWMSCSPGHDSSESDEVNTLGFTDPSDDDDELPVSQLVHKAVKSGDSGDDKLRGTFSKKHASRQSNSLQSAYAIFFDDVQSAIKAASPKVKFSKVAEIVASAWDRLDEASKQEYKSKAESDNQLSQEIHSKNKLMPKKTDFHSWSSKKAVHKRNPDLRLVRCDHKLGKSASHSQAEKEIKCPDEASVKLDEESFKEKPMKLGEESFKEKPMKLGEESFKEKPSQSAPSTSLNKQEADEVILCRRSECFNLAVDDPKWWNDYCCSQCVITHCRDTFKAWVLKRQL